MLLSLQGAPAYSVEAARGMLWTHVIAGTNRCFNFRNRLTDSANECSSEESLWVFPQRVNNLVYSTTKEQQEKYLYLMFVFLGQSKIVDQWNFTLQFSSFKGTIFLKSSPVLFSWIAGQKYVSARCLAETVTSIDLVPINMITEFQLKMEDTRDQ